MFDKPSSQPAVMWSISSAQCLQRQLLSHLTVRVLHPNVFTLVSVSADCMCVLCLYELTVHAASRHTSNTIPMKNGIERHALFNNHTCHTWDSWQHNISQLLTLQLLTPLIQMLMNERWKRTKIPPWWFEEKELSTCSLGCKFYDEEMLTVQS